MQSISRLFIILLLGGNLAAQTGIVTGQVIDRATGLPLVGANVMVRDFKLGSATDLSGRYSLMLQPGTFEITCSVIGYALIT